MIVGVDPGRYGGIAFLNGEFAVTFPMPATTGHDYRVWEIMNLLVEDPPEKRELLVIERVTRPASLTRCMGIFEGLGVALGYRVETVRPQEWKKHFGLGADKQASLDLARERFPHLAHEFKRVTRDDGKAEALLIALYAKEVGL